MELTLTEHKAILVNISFFIIDKALIQQSSTNYYNGCWLAKLCKAFNKRIKLGQAVMKMSNIF